MKFKFYKMQGCGNDFLFLDSMNSEPPRFLPGEIRYLCDRNFGIGADGLVVLHVTESQAEAGWTFYNSDGSTAEMCGNAARCAIRFLADRYVPGDDPISLDTKAGVIRGRKLPSGQVEITLLPQKDFHFEYQERVLELEPDVFQVYVTNTGVPHAVIEVKDIQHYPIDRVGRGIQAHPMFQPAGTNVTFFQRLVSKRIRSTTFERGVEAETLACGTGAAASALVFSELYLEPFPIAVSVPGGELEVDLSPVSKVLLLRGPAEYVFQAEIELIPKDFEKTLVYGAKKKRSP